jgi:hypothetical protein
VRLCSRSKSLPRSQPIFWLGSEVVYHQRAEQPLDDRQWRKKSQVAYIELGLKKFVDTYAPQEISSIAFPKLGFGNGGLDCEQQVRPLMEKYLNSRPVEITIYE